MNHQILGINEILAGYDAVSALYPYIPSMSHWRAWEYAAYKRFSLSGRILDVGCGDGRYFKLIWPEANDVVGIDLDPGAAESGRLSGVYRQVHTAGAHSIPEPASAFDHVFANCSLEHMDHLDAVLAEIHRCLRPGGTLLCSVVTNRFIEWPPLPRMAELAGYPAAVLALREQWMDYHHLVNPLPVADWMQRLKQAGLRPETHIPILPQYNSGAFLLMDGLWHVQQAKGGCIGDTIHSLLSTNPNFPGAFRKILEGLLEMETEWQDCSGAVFLARKPERTA